MNISAINCTPIKPQASFGNTAQGVDEAKKVLELSKQLNDSFKKEGEEPTTKHPLQTALSVLGAAATMFALGKGAGKGAVAVAKKLPDVAKANITKYADDAIAFVKSKASKMPKVPQNNVTTAIGNVAKNTFNSAKNVILKNPEKSFTTAAGVLAATTLVPSIVKADGNEDGIADIAQNNINAYASAFKTAEIFADMVNALA